MSEIYFKSMQVDRFYDDGSIIDDPLSPCPTQPALSAREGSTYLPTTVPYYTGGSNMEAEGVAGVTDQGWLNKGIPVGSMVAVGGENPLLMASSMWTQASQEAQGVLNVTYPFVCPWRNLKSTNGAADGGEFGYFYFGLWRAAASPTLAVQLTDTAGTVWGETLDITPAIEGAGSPSHMRRIALTTADLLPSWPDTSAPLFNMTTAPYIMNLKATLTADDDGTGVFTARFGPMQIYTSYVPAIKQNAQW